MVITPANLISKIQYEYDSLVRGFLMMTDEEYAIADLDVSIRKGGLFCNYVFDKGIVRFGPERLEEPVAHKDRKKTRVEFRDINEGASLSLLLDPAHKARFFGNSLYTQDISLRLR